MDPCLARLDDREDDPAEFDPVVGSRQPAQLVGQQPGDRLETSCCREFDPQAVVDGADGRPAGGDRASVVDDADGIGFGVVDELADDLLDDILQRCQADDRPELVDDDHHPMAVPLHLGQQLVDRLRCRDEDGIGEDRLQ